MSTESKAFWEDYHKRNFTIDVPELLDAYAAEKEAAKDKEIAALNTELKRLREGDAEPIADENGLLPCPFCGGRADGYADPDHPTGGGGAMWIECTSCGTKAKWSHCYDESRENWNRRAGKEAQGE